MTSRAAPHLRHAVLAPAALAAVLAAGLLASAGVAPAQEMRATGDNTPAMPAPDAQLQQQVEDFYHYAKLGRYELAVPQAEAILGGGSDPAALLAAFRTAARQRGDNLDNWLAIWQGVDDQAMTETAARLVEALNEGRRNVASDPAYIRQQIERLNVNEVGYRNGLANLRNSGELAVPLLLADLNNPNKRAQHPVLRRALQDLGRMALAPLLAATNAEDADVLAEVVSVLGDIGYDDAVPYVQKVRQRPGLPAGASQAADQAIARLARGSAGDMGQNFYDLAENLYYGRSSIQADTRYPEVNVWKWQGGQLTADRVPPEIYNEVLAMQAAANALSASSGMDEALALWLASNYKRAAELPEGATDTTRPADDAGPQYYGVTAGSPYTAAALRRALDDRNAAVALASIESLQETLGNANVSGGGDTVTPLIDALRYPDRRVRFEAALTLAGALPTDGFGGSEQVVPLLGEALSQTGSPAVIVVAPTQDQANTIAQTLEDAGYQAEAATSSAEAVEASRGLPAVDAVVVVDEFTGGEVDRLFDFLGSDRKTNAAARIVVTPSAANRFDRDMANNPLVSTVQSTDGGSLKSALEAGRSKAGALPLDEQLATDYALRAGEALATIADADTTYELGGAKNALIGALEDGRQPVQLLAADVLGALDDADAQTALLSAAGEDAAASELRIGLYEALAKNARAYGNRLGGDGVTTLREAVTQEANLEVRTAAAKAYGALSLPSDQAKQLVVSQAE